MKTIIKSFLALFFLACTSAPVVPKKIELEYPKELAAVNQLILERKTHDARLKVEEYLNKAENINWYGHAYFLQAFLYELDENFPQSIKYYREAIQHGSQYESKVEAKALYNLSFVYERIDEREKLVSTLVDLMKRRAFFDILTGQVEIPARLAAAYASQGRLKEAIIFHKEASRNFHDLVRNARFKADRSELSKSLYYLGFATFDENNESFDSLIFKLDRGQKYFLASAEASNSVWSQRAVDRLRAEYDRAWGMVQQYSPRGLDHDPQALKKQKQRGQLIMASQLYDLMFKLEAEEFPMLSVNKRSKDLVENSKDWIEKIEKFALNLDVGPEMIRNKKIKNKKLARYVDDEIKKVKVNKEKIETSKADAPSAPSEKPLPPKQDIGKDPNL